MWKLLTYSDHGVKWTNDLLECEVADCLKPLQKKYNSIDWFVLTGGNETEVKDIFHKKKIKYFKEDNI